MSLSWDFILTFGTLAAAVLALWLQAPEIRDSRTWLWPPILALACLAGMATGFLAWQALCWLALYVTLAIAGREVSDSGWSAGLGLYCAGATPSGQSRYGRQDLTVSKTFRIARATLTPVLTVSHSSDRLTTSVYDVNRTVVNGYSDATRYAASIRVSY